MSLTLLVRDLGFGIIASLRFACKTEESLTSCLQVLWPEGVSITTRSIEDLIRSCCIVYEKQAVYDLANSEGGINLPCSQEQSRRMNIYLNDLSP